MSTNSYIKKSEKPIIKYYTIRTYNPEAYNYKSGYFFTDEIQYKFDFERKVQECFDVVDTITKVYYHNAYYYKQKIPYKSESYCHTLKAETVSIYDNSGKLIKHMYRNTKETYTYTPNMKIKITSNVTTNDRLLTKYIYDKNKNLITILEYKNGELYSQYKRLNKKNILYKIDNYGNSTGEFISLNDDGENAA